MGVKKLSIALDERIAAAAASAERLGLSLSAWLNRAAQNALATEDGLEAVAEVETTTEGMACDQDAACDTVW